MATADASSAQRAYAGRIGPEAMLVDFRLGDGIDGLETIAVLRRAFSWQPRRCSFRVKAAHSSWRVQSEWRVATAQPLPPARLRSLLAHLFRPEADAVAESAESSQPAHDIVCRVRGWPG